MKIKTFVSKYFASNTYLITNDDAAVIIDPSVDLDTIKPFLGSKKIDAILLTHAHADHFACLDKYFNEYKCKIYCHTNAFDKISDPNKNLSYLLGEKISFNIPKSQFVFVNDEEEFAIRGFSFKALETLGHSNCSICYIIDEVLFSGDTLFKLTVGRTDLYTSNSRELIKSLSKISNLKTDYFIYPGHDEDTMLSFEKAHNRYLRHI